MPPELTKQWPLPNGGHFIYMRILDKERKNYNHRFRDNDACIFCADGELLECPGLGSPTWRVLVNRYPYMDGNLMLVPRRHAESPAELSAAEWIEFGAVASRTLAVLGEVFGVDSFNIGLNIGPESGASLPHLHWQVIPRKFKNITAMNTFADLYVVKIRPEETKRMIGAYLRKTAKKKPVKRQIE